MNTKLLMTASAVLMGLAGMMLLFLPQELLSYLEVTPIASPAFVIQLAGVLYLSFAMINWMAKANLTGGIYNLPIAMGNFLHFMAGTVLLMKIVNTSSPAAFFWMILIVYGLFALLFGIVLFRHPLKNEKPLTRTTV